MTHDPRLWMTRGASDLIETIQRLVERVGTPADLDVLTMGAGHAHAGRLADMRERGILLRVRLTYNAGTMDMRRDEGTGRDDARDIERHLGEGSIRAIRTHLKAVRVVGPKGEAAVLTSANLNRNSRPEQYEDADHLASAIGAIQDAIFAVAPVGEATEHTAYSGLRAAMRAVDARGITVWPDAQRIPRATISGMGDDHAIIVERVGVGAMLPALYDLAGRGATLDACTWGLSVGDATGIRQALDDGRLASAHLAIPARMGRRSDKRSAFCAVLDLLHAEARWSPTHAKIAVVEGPAWVFVLTGGANFNATGQLDIIRMRRGDRDLARHARTLVHAMPKEPAPAMPSAGTRRRSAPRRLPRQAHRSSPDSASNSRASKTSSGCGSPAPTAQAFAHRLASGYRRAHAGSRLAALHRR